MSKIFDQIIKVLGSMFTSSSVKNDTVYQVRAAYKNDDDSEASAVTLLAHSSGTDYNLVQALTALGWTDLI